MKVNVVYQCLLVRYFHLFLKATVLNILKIKFVFYFSLTPQKKTRPQNVADDNVKKRKKKHVNKLNVKQRKIVNNRQH